MAKGDGSKILQTLQRLSGRFDFAKVDKKALVPNTRTGMKQVTLVSELERTKILEKAARVDTSNMPMSGQYSGLLQYVQTTMNQSTTERVENERIMRMVPEYSQARDIMISTLMQPNNLMDNRITIECDMEVLSADIRQKISLVVSEFFEEYLNLSTALPEWTNEAMYLGGSKPLLILPQKSFSKFLDAPHKDVTRAVPVLESFSSKRSESAFERAKGNTSLFGFSDKKLKQSDSVTLESYAGAISTNDINVSIEDHFAAFAAAEMPSMKKIKNTKPSAVTAVVKDIIGSLEVIDDPGIAAFNDIANNQVKVKMTNTVMSQYSETGILEVDGTKPDGDNPPDGRPLLLQPPTESVIPLYTPGTPDDPFGFIIVINPQTGHFVNLSDQAMYGNGDSGSSGLPGSNTFGQLFNAFGFSSLGSAATTSMAGQTLMASIYQDVLETHIKRTASNAGFADIKIGTEPAVVRALLARYLQHRKTSLLFVPANLMVYYHFKTGPNGCGVSKLDDSKFILSLRISLLVCRMMTAFNQAIDRRTLTIAFPQKFRANPVEYINMLKQQYVMKSAVSFSPWPETTAEQLVSKGITVKAENMPGLSDFSIGNEPNDQQRVMPDTQLSDDIKNLSILSTDVPAYALNNMGEQEYSRSIATTDLAFARRIVKSQKIICKHMTKLVRTWTAFDAVLISELKVIVAKELAEMEKSNDPGVADVDKSGKIDINDVIASLHVTLPSPVVAPTKAQFENITDTMSALDTVISGQWPDELAGGNQELQSTLGTIRAFMKQIALDGYVDRLGLGGITIPDIKDLPMGENSRWRLLLNNFRNAVVELDKLVKQKAPDDDGQGGAMGGMGGDMSGGMGMDQSADMGDGTDAGTSLPDDTGSAGDTGDMGSAITSAVSPSGSTDDAGTGEPTA